MKKKLFALFVFAFALIAMAPGVFAAENTDGSSTQAAAQEDEYYDTIEEAAAYVRSQMVLRNESFVVKYATSEKPTKALISEIFHTALKHTGNPDEGDYLTWQYKKYYSETTYKNEDGVYKLTITYTMEYYTTYEQEQAVDAAVASAISSMSLSGKSDYEKVCVIHDYILKNVTYDASDSAISHSCYGALINGKAVCQGYVVLFYRLCLEAGVDVRVIDGTYNGSAHGWNIVSIDGTYYYADATLNDSLGAGTYFLVGSDTMAAAFSASDDGGAIIAAYNISSSDYAAKTGSSSAAFSAGTAQEDAAQTVSSESASDAGTSLDESGGETSGLNTTEDDLPDENSGPKAADDESEERAADGAGAEAIAGAGTEINYPAETVYEKTPAEINYSAETSDGTAAAEISCPAETFYENIAAKINFAQDALHENTAGPGFEPEENHILSAASFSGADSVQLHYRKSEDALSGENYMLIRYGYDDTGGKYALNRRRSAAEPGS